MKLNKYIIAIIFAQVFILSCTKSPYDELVNNESSKSVVLDSLIFNFHFGDSNKFFYKECLRLNKEKLIMQGPNNKYALYTLQTTNENESSIKMLFYGAFDDNNIMTGMDFLFSYDYWNALTDDYSAQKLIPQMKDTLMNWYPGNDFIPFKIPNQETAAFVKIDANRQILIYPKDTRYLVVKIEDLRSKYPSKYK